MRPNFDESICLECKHAMLTKIKAQAMGMDGNGQIIEGVELMTQPMCLKGHFAVVAAVLACEGFEQAEEKKAMKQPDEQHRTRILSGALRAV